VHVVSGDNWACLHATECPVHSLVCSIAPVLAFIETFKRAGISIDQPIARGPMGLNKRDHIKAILAVPSVAQQWQSKHGNPWSERDVDALYHAFTPVQIETVRRRADPIPGALSVIAGLRKTGVKVGSCSGYNEPIMAVLQEEAAKQGLTTDAVTWYVWFACRLWAVAPFLLTIMLQHCGDAATGPSLFSFAVRTPLERTAGRSPGCLLVQPRCLTSTPFVHA
jgi:hypothetical protein